MKQIMVYIVGFVFLFGLLSTSAIANETHNKINASLQNKQKNLHTSHDELDQFQLEQTERYNMPVGRFFNPDPLVDVYVQVAQSFIPTKDILTRVEILIGKNATASHPYFLAIREELTQENIVEVSCEPEEIVTENYSWIEFDIKDTALTVGETYYLVCYTENVTENLYAWALNNLSESYQHGCAWVSFDDGGNWTNESFSSQSNENYHVLLPHCGARDDENLSDMCFKTYGMDATQLDIEIEQSLFFPKIFITNSGERTAYDVEWTFSLTGGFLDLINASSSDAIAELPAGEAVEIVPSLGLLFGFGPVTITVEAWAVNAPKVIDSFEGFMFFIFFYMNLI